VFGKKTLNNHLNSLLNNVHYRYFLNILVDTTLGVLIIWGVLSAVKFVTRFYRLNGFQSGVYGEPPLTNQTKIWAKQLGVYVMALVIMKIVVLILFGICPWLEDFGEWVLTWTMGNYRIQVLFVMLVYVIYICIYIYDMNILTKIQVFH
jgi:hypothetical protein